jgi:hypothetical protein
MQSQALGNSTPMQFGQQYSFTFSQSAIPFVAANNNEIVEAVTKSLPQLSGVSVSGESSFGGSVDITFIYNDSDNNDSVGDVGQYMAQLISAQFTVDGFTFIQGFGGPTGSQGAPDSDLTGLSNLSSTIGKTALYVGIGVVLVIVAIKFA